MFARPTLEELITRTRGEVASRLGLDALQPRSLLRVLADTMAGASHQLHGRLSYVAEQAFPDTASAEELDRWSGVWEVLRKAASYSAGAVTFTGSSGAVIPAGAAIQYPVTGWTYRTLTAATISGGTATVNVQATDPGSDGNVEAGTELTLSQAVPGVDSMALAGAGGLSGGAGRETDESLRARLLQRIRAPFQGGSAENYVTWALEVPGVTRAWALANHLGLGSVGVTFVRDDDVGSIVPDTGEVAAVQAVMDERRPVTALVVTFAPAIETIDLTIALTPNTAAVQAAVEASLADLINRETEPGGTMYLSHLREAISTAEGEIDHNLTVPSADVVASAGAIHQLGTVTWI